MPHFVQLNLEGIKLSAAYVNHRPFKNLYNLDLKLLKESRAIEHNEHGVHACN
jgi:hypothetical protein